MGIDEIKEAVIKLKENSENITLESPKSWTTAKDVVSKTHGCLKSLLKILEDTDDSEENRFLYSKDILPVTLDTVQSASELVNRLFIRVTERFNVRESEIVQELTEIPAVMDDIAGFLTPEKPIELSDSANIKGVKVEEIKSVRVDLFGKCVTFASFMCDKLKSLLEVIRESNCRSFEAFKPFLVGGVKQYMYIQRACACLRELLEFTSDKERHQHMEGMKNFFGKMKDILIEGKRIINSLSSGEEFPNDFKATIPPTINHIKQCYKNINAFEGGSNKELNKVLMDIEEVCDGISRAAEYGKKCLPPGEEYLGEDVAVLGSDFYPDFEPSITKVSLSEYEEVTKTNDLLPTEVVGVYKLCDITRDIKVKVDIRRLPATSHVGGKIVKKGAKPVPIKEKDIKLQGMVIECPIISGVEFLLLYYKFPFVERKLSKAEARDGVVVNEETSCKIRIPATDIQGEVNVKYKEYNIEKDRVEGYKNENPEEFGCFEISNGLHIDADNNSTGVVVEFKNKNVTKESKYFKIQVKMEGGKRRWDAESVTCTEGKGMVSIEVEKKTTTYIVTVNGNIPSPTDDQPTDLPKLVREKSLTLLGVQSQCKALILYRIPHYDEFDENEDDEIELRVECIESQRFYLHNRAESQRKNGNWIQFVDGDESSDFLIKDRSKIEVVIKGILKASDHYIGKKELQFLKGSSCFIEIPLTVTKKTKGKGWVYCYRSDKPVHWKSITWDQIVKRYTEAMEAPKTISKDERKLKHKGCEDNQKTMESRVKENMKVVVQEIFKKLTQQEKDGIQENHMFKGIGGQQGLVDRFVARAKQEKNGFRFLMNVLREVGRNDLVQELTERAEVYGNPT